MKYGHKRKADRTFSYAAKKFHSHDEVKRLFGLFGYSEGSKGNFLPNVYPTFPFPTFCRKIIL